MTPKLYRQRKIVRLFSIKVISPSSFYPSLSFPVYVHVVPGPVVITPFPSFFKISITWNPPDMSNGIIIAYEVSYRPRDSSQPDTRLNTTDLATSFTTQSDLEMGTELIFFVRAFTRVGPGSSTSVVVSTLERPREKHQLLVEYCYYLQCIFIIHSCSTRSGGDVTQ